ncbi:unnamed protein product [Thlaspi arvense]|uniref:Uncharacterized protein n=1 Tax=Thlaspi arvense TaxID=13288 RepID=A0AAU9S4U4_THLAR|nr:unnamed protein product [Thlaspi arvense]
MHGFRNLHRSKTVPLNLNLESFLHRFD